MRTINNSIEVGDEYRKNPLSLKPGGVKVVVIMNNGYKKIYNKIKYPEAFANAIEGDNVREVVIMN